nr:MULTISPECIES: hypothetical protein [Streptomyces]
MTVRRGGAMSDRFRRWYGEGPLQLVVLLGSFAVAGYAGVRLLDGDRLLVALWFAGAALVHDVLFVPLYAVADGVLRAAVRRGGRPRERVALIRVPAFLSGLLLVVWFPLIAGRVGRYESTTGLPAGVFLTRWLLITAALFAAAASWRALCAVGGRRSARKRRPPEVH